MDGSTNESIFLPLDKSKAEIRLLYLQPRAVAGDEIACTLRLADLDTKDCEYEALSYEWGNKTKRILTVMINEEKVTVGENLWWALWYLRADEGERVIWVDALCINQKNNHEKNHQVGQMDQIYQRARRVIAWIGRDEQVPASGGEMNKPTEIECAIDFANLLLGGSHSTPYRIYYPNDPTRTYSNHFADWNVPPNHPGWICLLHLCKRTYWSRLWIIQELVLAQDIIIQCGYFLLSWKVIEHVLNLTRHITLQQLSLAPKLFRVYQIVAELVDSVPVKLCKQRGDRLMNPQSVHTLFELFCLHQNAACTLVQDKLFGLLAVSRECCRQAVNVDYSLSPSTLCRIFVEHHFKIHVGSITAKNREDWIYGIRHALVTFVGETYEGVFDGGRNICLHPYSSTAITSIPCKFRGEITANDDRTASDPLHIVDSFSRQSRLPLSPCLGAFQALTPASIRRIPFHPSTDFQFKDVDEWNLSPYLAVQSRLVPVGRSFITGGIGVVQPGDLVYQISERHSLILSQGCLVAIGTGFRSTCFVRPSLGNDYLSDQLYVDFSNLWGCCVLFEEGLKFAEYF